MDKIHLLSGLCILFCCHAIAIDFSVDVVSSSGSAEGLVSTSSTEVSSFYCNLFPSATETFYVNMDRDACNSVTNNIPVDYKECYKLTGISQGFHTLHLMDYGTTDEYLQAMFLAQTPASRNFLFHVQTSETDTNHNLILPTASIPSNSSRIMFVHAGGEIANVYITVDGVRMGGSGSTSIIPYGSALFIDLYGTNALFSIPDSPASPMLSSLTDLNDHEKYDLLRSDENNSDENKNDNLHMVSAIEQTRSTHTMSFEPTNREKHVDIHSKNDNNHNHNNNHDSRHFTFQSTSHTIVWYNDADDTVLVTETWTEPGFIRADEMIVMALIGRDGSTSYPLEMLVRDTQSLSTNQVSPANSLIFSSDPFSCLSFLIMTLMTVFFVSIDRLGMGMCWEF